MASLDRIAIQERGIPSLDLMERAGKGVADAILCHFPQSRNPLIVSGRGNNGGDGFVVARYLREAGRDPSVVLLAKTDELTEDARCNYERMRKECSLDGHAFLPDEQARVDDLRAVLTSEPDLIVDAVFGTGFRGSIRHPLVSLIEFLNAMRVPRVAVDIASGVVADDGSVGGVAFRADLTVTMALPKVGHFLPPGIDYTGRVEVVDIGIPEDLLGQKAADEADLLCLRELRDLLPRYRYSAHKGDRGHLLILAGSPGLTGAGCLAGEAALYSGAGLVTVGVPEPLNPIFETKLTEVMTLPLSAGPASTLASTALKAILDFAGRAQAVVFGPGVGKDEDTGKLLLELVKNLEKPLLIDADGLNLLAGRDQALKGRRFPTILTPHPGEMGRLIGKTTAEVQADRWGVARRFAEAWGVTLVLKGCGTVVASEGVLWVNPTGGPAMSQGGMGDTLSGLIGSLLAQGLGTADAARLGVFLHGLSADLCAHEYPGEVVTASEVGRGLRRAMAEMRAGKTTGSE
jgi:hydroxyethylthiazole kinase-like uncharacterized protein yjeF